MATLEKHAIGRECADAVAEKWRTDGAAISAAAGGLGSEPLPEK